MQSFQKYIQHIAQDFDGNKATEHTYRGDLRDFILSLLPEAYKLTNEPRRQKCGAPDYILEKGEVPVGYIEAKDVGRLDSLTPAEKDQFARYTASLDNLIYTDYLEFRFYKQGQKVATARIAELQNGKVVPLPENLDAFTNLIQNFATYQTQTIRSAKSLASMMAKKARLMKDVFQKILEEDSTGELHEQFETFKELLIHDISPADFADIYAETLAYGLFTARLHDTTLETFSREEAYGLIPSSNPFLKKLFQYISTDLDDRAIWIVDDLCDIFRATDVAAMLQSFNRGTGRTDPFLHFYESFLGEYNPTKKKARGVWYTPESVVSFIVRGVDEILQTHFGLAKGLADTSKTTIMVDTQTTDRRTKAGVKQVEQEVHRVQVLDVATGTGTFLAEVISQIHQRFANQQGMWSSYVEEHLIPRVHGFELLMASYAMCHMKLELLLRETGYQPKTNAPRLNVYLTNSLQQPEEDLDRLRLVKWFSNESNEASRIKRNSPIMVAIGNPPYNAKADVTNGYIQDLLTAYKKEPGGNSPLQERNPRWLNDDYVKFIRLGEHFINKNGDGIMAYITNHSWLDNPTFRGMRWHLLSTFDAIYVLDLHGNSKKKEVCPDGSADKNVFDIQQGVSIMLAVKTNKKDKKALADVYHADVWGSRDKKADFLDKNSLQSVGWIKLSPQSPFYFMIPKDVSLLDEYESGFSINKLFPLNGVGMTTAHDGFVIDDKETLLQRFFAFKNEERDSDALHSKYNVKKKQGWDILALYDELQRMDEAAIAKQILPVGYRPFDEQYIFYNSNAVWRRVEKVLSHMQEKNVALLFKRQSKRDFSYAFVTNKMVEGCVFESAFANNSVAPLYRYDSVDGSDKPTPNLDPTIWKKLQKATPAAEDPQAVFDYVYAVLHAPTYRIKYAEFLKSDFPRIPYPTSAEQFSKLAELGAHLRQLHLLEHTDCHAGTVGYPVDGSHEVNKPTYDEAEQRVYINESQYFSNVPPVAWAFPIGGYQPAQKWLKDRKGRALSLDDITHYQRIIATLTKTAELMERVDEIYSGDK
ncbi:MAG: DNA methyltransferase [Alphaproteobacteria bacterium CG_4_10_14_0_8_um_filter_53_9]|nr:MAG: DNA methyltransferase [Alphaproteobacteria bacterium CG_4_10_14_0_8_um_filter_53_9]